tara:strand:- start:401 stop:805 length:405 start_codon:yes stop_codon:yes gene_type:complete
MQVFDEVNTDVQNDADLGNNSKELTAGLYAKYPALFDSAILMAFILLVLFVVVSVFMLDTHPVFFIISVVLLLMIFIVTTLLANVYDDIMLDDEISPYANQFPYTSWIMSNLLELSMAIGFIVMIVLFIKFRTS